MVATDGQTVLKPSERIGGYEQPQTRPPPRAIRYIGTACETTTKIVEERENTWRPIIATTTAEVVYNITEWNDIKKDNKKKTTKPLSLIPYLHFECIRSVNKYICYTYVT